MSFTPIAKTNCEVCGYKEVISISLLDSAWDLGKRFTLLHSQRSPTCSATYLRIFGFERANEVKLNFYWTIRTDKVREANPLIIWLRS